ncbi:MAG: PD-(D/E)XK nuclease family protein [Atopobiaceae bacterium]|nr:PD-(D/E)XK nuclease family protein [Atopobiaceae bacterium]
MPLRIIRTTDGRIASPTLLSAVREGLAPVRRAVVLVPSFSQALAVEEALSAEPGLALGVAVSTPGAWAAERWGLYGDGTAFVDPTARGLLMGEVLAGAPAEARGPLGSGAGTVRLLCRLAAEALDAMPIDASGGLERDVADELLLCDAERASVAVLALYAARLRERGLVEPVCATGVLGTRMREAGAQVPPVVAAGFSSMDAATFALVEGMSGVTDVACVVEGPQPSAASPAERLVRALGSAVPAGQVPLPAGSAAGRSPATRGPELAALASGDLAAPDGAVRPSGGVTQLLAGGPSAEAALVRDAVLGLAADGATRVVVAVPQASRAVRELVPRLVASGLAARSSERVRVGQTVEGRALLSFAAGRLAPRGARVSSRCRGRGLRGVVAAPRRGRLPPELALGRVCQAGLGPRRALARDAHAPPGTGARDPLQVLSDVGPLRPGDRPRAGTQRRACGAGARARASPPRGGRRGAPAGCSPPWSRSRARHARSPGRVPGPRRTTPGSACSRPRARPPSRSASRGRVPVGCQGRGHGVFHGGAARAMLGGRPRHLRPHHRRVAPHRARGRRGCPARQGGMCRGPVPARARPRDVPAACCASRRNASSSNARSTTPPPTRPILPSCSPSSPPATRGASTPSPPRAGASISSPRTSPGRAHGRRLLSTDRPRPAGDLDPGLRDLVVVPRIYRGEVVSDPMPFSATQVERYLECPYKWFALKRLGLRDVDAGFGFMQMGNLVHATLEATHARLIERACRGRGPRQGHPREPRRGRLRARRGVRGRARARDVPGPLGRDDRAARRLRPLYDREAAQGPRTPARARGRHVPGLPPERLSSSRWGPRPPSASSMRGAASTARSTASTWTTAAGPS